MDRRVTEDVLVDMWFERERQRQSLGVQRLPDGTGRIGDAHHALDARERCDRAAVAGELTWRDALNADVAVVIASTDEDALRASLLRATAVAAQWIEDLDRRWLERQRKA